MMKMLGKTILASVVLASAGCDKPISNTDLRPEGAPEVLTVLAVAQDGYEYPVFCKADDDKVPRLVVGGVIICPRPGFEDPAPDAVVGGIGGERGDNAPAQFRIVFDELLNGDIVEEIVDDQGNPCDPLTKSCIGTIANTRPVDVVCDGTAITTYDGYYAPNGNNVTNPPGPSIVVAFDATSAAAGSTCTVTVKDLVVDKQGVAVDAAGPFAMQLAEFAFAGTDPETTAAEPATVEADGSVAFLFNYPVDGASVALTDVELRRDTAPVLASISVDGSAILVSGVTPFLAGTYTATIPAGAEIAETGGATLTIAEAVEIHFTVE